MCHVFDFGDSRNLLEQNLGICFNDLRYPTLSKYGLKEEDSSGTASPFYSSEYTQK